MSVSRVLRDSATVTEPIRSQVETAIAQLGYVPNRAARLLSGTSQFRVGLLYNHPRSAYAVDLLHGAMEQAALADIQLAVRGCTLSKDDADVLRGLIADRVDAIVLTAPLCESAELLSILKDAAVLTMSIGTSLRPSLGCALHIDEFAAAYDMTRHIAQMGHRQIGFITGNNSLSCSHLRLSGFREAMKDCGITYNASLVVPGLFTYRSGLVAAEQLLKSDDPPSAIFASNDDMAAAVVATAHRLDLKVPSQVAVCGFDDSWIATNIWPELTTVRQPVEKMGFHAISMIKDMLSSKVKQEVSRTALFTYEIVDRESTGLQKGLI